MSLSDKIIECYGYDRIDITKTKDVREAVDSIRKRKCIFECQNIHEEKPCASCRMFMEVFGEKLI